MLAFYCGGRVAQDVLYPLPGTPCATVLGQSFRAYPSGVQALFPDDHELRERGTQAYAGDFHMAGFTQESYSPGQIARMVIETDAKQLTWQVFRAGGESVPTFADNVMNGAPMTDPETVPWPTREMRSSSASWRSGGSLLAFSASSAV